MLKANDSSCSILDVIFCTPLTSVQFGLIIRPVSLNITTPINRHLTRKKGQQETHFPSHYHV